MRTAILVLSSLGVVGALFGVYCKMQAGTHVVVNSIQPTAMRPSTQSSVKGYKQGHNVWMEQFDEKTGRLATKFKAEDYFPRPSGVIHAIKPVANFYLGNDKRLEVVGVDGDVVMKDTPDITKGFANSGPSGPPNRGRLNTVTMKLFDELEPDPNRQLILTVNTDNISFDNETFRITTEPYLQADGTTVAADQVPVHMKGQYDFEGRGLTIRWNDRDGRLELLEIAHGESLTIHNPSGSTGVLGGGKHGAPRPSSVSLLPHPDALASRDPQAANLALPSTKPNGGRRGPRQPKPPAEPVKTVYQANFFDNVRVTQGPDTFATADQLRVHFLMKGEGSGTPKFSTRPTATTKPATQPFAARSSEQVVTADGGVDVDVPTSQPADDARAPKTRPSADVPVVVTWTGKLRMTPVTTEPPRPVTPGDATVELLNTDKSNTPVLVHRGASAGQEATEVHCASVLYQTSDGSAFLSNSNRIAHVIMNRLATSKSAGNDAAASDAKPTASAPQSEVTCDQLEYHASQHFALLLGEGHAVLPLDSETHGRRGAAATAPATRTAGPSFMDAKWKRQGKLYFVPRSGDDMAIERATFDGDVDVVHPQLVLKSQSLELAFDPAAEHSTTRPTKWPQANAVGAADTRPTTKPARSAKPQLRNLVAFDNVYCQLKDSAGKQQTIECSRLELDTAQDEAGKMYPHQVFTSGAVHAYDEAQDLRAGKMDITLRPTQKHAGTTRPVELASADNAGQVDTSAVELQKMIATEKVVVVNREGSTATADELHVDMIGDEPQVMLTGPTLARVWDAQHNVLTGPTILVEPKKGTAHVVGPGTLHVVRQDGPSTRATTREAVAAGHRTDVVWSDKADVDGQLDRIDVYGKVVATMPNADGTVDNARAEHMRIDLQRKAPTPTTAPIAVAEVVRPQAVALPGGLAPPTGESPAPRRHKSPTTGPTSPMQMDLFKDKEPAAITLSDDAIVRSSLTAPNGDILREFELTAPTIRYTMADTKDLPAHSLLVPTAGQMIIRDHRDPAEKQADKKAGKKPDDEGGLGSDRGATAFQWSKQLLYTEESHHAVMTGDVMVVHQGDGSKDIPVRLDADTVTAVFEASTRKSATAPAAPASQPAQQAMQLKGITAQGHTVVTRGQQQLTADRIDFDPKSHWMTAYGSGRTLASFSDPAGKGTTTGDEIAWNTVTWNFKALNMSSKSSR